MKTALVTGTGCDVGREVALFLGSKGYKILTHGTAMKKALEETHEKLKAGGIAFTPYLADYASLDQVGDMCRKIRENEGEIGAIVHVAGGSTAFGPFKITPQQTIDAVNVNLVAPMIITHELLPKLGDDSLIVFTSALSGFHAGWYPTDACFDAAKGGILRFTENMARNLGPRTRVNSIVIGLSYVDDNYKEWRQARTDQIPMGRVAYPEDYVKCVEFFLTNRYVTGVSLPLDGGWMAYNVNPGFGTALMQK
jgi:NAD(P)-dependent dehydrogenase (short-subunit alcohol dehydrogenase family)